MLDNVSIQMLYKNEASFMMKWEMHVDHDEMLGFTNAEFIFCFWEFVYDFTISKGINVLNFCPGLVMRFSTGWCNLV